jgi:hypothetical protein
VITVASLLGLIGPVAGVVGILLAVGARRRASRAVTECAALIQGSVGSRGTVDPRALRDLAIVRYDALNEMSGQLSFSVALLNAAGDGVVISSINGRSETRTYAKVVLGGHGTQELSPEEGQAVRSARLGVGLGGGPRGDAGRPYGRTSGLDETAGVADAPAVRDVLPLPPAAANRPAPGGPAPWHRTSVGSSRPV